MVVLVANVQGASGAHSDSDRVVEKRGNAVAIKVTRGSATCDGVYYAMGGDHADTIVARVRNKKVTIGSKGELGWIRKCSRDACAIQPSCITTRKGGHCAIGEDKPDAVVVSVSHKDVSTVIHGYTLRGIKSCSASPHTIGKGWRAITTSRASQGGHCTRGVDFTNAVAARVCHIHHPRIVYSEAVGIVKVRKGPLSISPRGKTTPCKCGSHSRGRELPYAAAPLIRNVDDARAWVGCDTRWVRETSCNPCAIS